MRSYHINCDRLQPISLIITLLFTPSRSSYCDRSDALRRPSWRLVSRRIVAVFRLSQQLQSCDHHSFSSWPSPLCRHDCRFLRPLYQTTYRSAVSSVRSWSKLSSLAYLRSPHSQISKPMRHVSANSLRSRRCMAVLSPVSVQRAAPMIWPQRKTGSKDSARIKGRGAAGGVTSYQRHTHQHRQPMRRQPETSTSKHWQLKRWRYKWAKSGVPLDLGMHNLGNTHCYGH